VQYEMPCWALVIVAWLVHVVWFRRCVAEPLFDYSSFLLDTNHFRALTTYTRTCTSSHSASSFIHTVHSGVFERLNRSLALTVAVMPHMKRSHLYLISETFNNPSTCVREGSQESAVDHERMMDEVQWVFLRIYFKHKSRMVFSLSNPVKSS